MFRSVIQYIMSPTLLFLVLITLAGAQHQHFLDSGHVDQLYEYEDQSAAILYLPNGDSESFALKLERPIHFYSEKYDEIFINTNGILTFNTEFSEYINQPFPLEYPSIAPFYSNVDTSSGDSSNSVSIFTSHLPEQLEKASNLVRSAFRDESEFEANELVVATWRNVGYFNAKGDKLNTFQAVLIVNDDKTFVQFTYPRGGINWLQGEVGDYGLPDVRAQAGFIAEDGHYFNLNGSGLESVRLLGESSNVGVAGVWLFSVGPTDASGEIKSPDNENVITQPALEQPTCASNGEKQCDAHAQCYDKAQGFCCACNDGYYGNGNICLKNNQPLRVTGTLSGQVNGQPIDERSALQSYVLLTDGRSYTSINPLETELGGHLRFALPIFSTIGWLFAKPINGALNGYQLTGGSLVHTSTVHFESGEQLIINQTYDGLNYWDQLAVRIHLHGEVPHASPAAKLHMADYIDEYRFVAPNQLSSVHPHAIEVAEENRVIKFQLQQTINFERCLRDDDVDPTDSTVLQKVAKVSLNYFEKDQALRASVLNKIGVDAESNACTESSAICGENTVCVPYEDTYRCDCLHGYAPQVDGELEICVDIDECELGTHVCDANAICSNNRGGFTCSCFEGYEGDGYRCFVNGTADNFEAQTPAPAGEDVGQGQANTGSAQSSYDENSQANQQGYDQGQQGYDHEYQQPPQRPEEQQPQYPEEQQPQRPHEQDPQRPQEQDPQRPQEQDPRRPEDQNPDSHQEQHPDGWQGGQTGAGGDQGQYPSGEHDQYPGGQQEYYPDGQQGGRPPTGGHGYYHRDDCYRCSPEADCVDGRCECRHGFSGDGYNCQRLCVHDEVWAHGRCVPLLLDEHEVHPQCTVLGECTCPEGYELTEDTSMCRYASPLAGGDDDSQRIDLIPCDVDSNCHVNATCEWNDRELRHVCSCSFGFSGDGYRCEPLDDSCVLRPLICDPYASCNYNSAIGKSECQCNRGYEGDGFRCRLAPECREDSHCGENSFCNLGVCGCLDGFERDSSDKCSPAGRCGVVYCGANAICKWDTQQSVDYCDCMDGYEGDALVGCKSVPTPCNVQNNCGIHANCEPTEDPARYQCQCTAGFHGDGYVCIEDQNCLNNPHMCDMNAKCLSTNSGLVCVCAAGFYGNGSICQERQQHESGFLLVSQGVVIARVPLSGKNVKPISVASMAIGLDKDCVEGRVYWGDISTKKIVSAKYDGTDLKNFITEDVESPEGIAIDYISRRLYWADSVKDTIEVASLDDPSMRAVLINKNLVNPRGIVVDPYREKLYWSDWDRESPKIEMSDLDGTGRELLVGKDAVTLPNSLVVLDDSGELCYADAGTKKVECIDAQTKQIRTVSNELTYPFGLAYTHNQFYWTDWTTKKLESVDSSGNRQKGIQTPFYGSHKMYGMTAVDDNCPQTTSACQINNGGCTDARLCLANRKAPSGKSCKCTKLSQQCTLPSPYPVYPAL